MHSITQKLTVYGNSEATNEKNDGGNEEETFFLISLEELVNHQMTICVKLSTLRSRIYTKTQFEAVHMDGCSHGFNLFRHFIFSCTKKRSEMPKMVTTKIKQFSSFRSRIHYFFQPFV